MIALSDLLGQDAIALGTAAKTGTVKGVVIRGDRIVGVELSEMTIEASTVRSFEGDVLTYDDSTAPTEGDRAGSADPRGALVLDMNGDGLGTIKDLTITADGHIDTIVMNDDSTVPGARLRAIGTYAAIVGVDLPPPTGPPVG